MELLDNQLVVVISSLIVGAALSLLTRRIFLRRGLFTYSVQHARLGISADDLVLGSVRVTWNGTEVSNLYSSTIELRNESFRDYEDVIVRVYTGGNAMLLTGRTEILGTTHWLNLTDDFLTRVTAQPGQQSQAQIDLYNTQRDYILPTFNRRQVVLMTFLTVPLQGDPIVLLDIIHKGVKLKYHVALNQVYGVPQPYAALAGTGIGLVFLAIVIGFVDSVSLAAILSFVFGVLVLLPGVLLIKTWRFFRDWTGG